MIEITRRILISGSAAALATSTIAIADPMKPVLTDSPLFTIINGSDAAFFGYNFNVLKNQTHWSTAYTNSDSEPKYPSVHLIHKVVPSDGVAVRSIEEAEDHFIALASKRTASMALLPFDLRRNAAYLCCENRRGMANLVMMHPALAERWRTTEHAGWMFDDTVGKPKIDCFNPTNEPDACRLLIDYAPVVGRWKRAGTAQKLGVIYTSDHLPENEAIYVYRDKIGPKLVDGAAVLFRPDAPGEPMSLVLMQDTGKFSLEAGAYIRRVVFT